MLLRLYFIDDTIVSWFERVANFIQRGIGLSAIHLARLCIVLAVFFIQWKSPKANDVLLIGVMGIKLMGTFFGNDSTSAANSLTMTQEHRPYKKIWRLLLLVLFFLCLTIDIYTLDLWFEIWVLSEYFKACRDLPWQKSKLRQFLESLASRPEPVTSASPA